MSRPADELLQVIGEEPQKQTGPKVMALRELVGRFNRCVRNFHLYPKGSPVFDQSLDLLYSSFQRFLEQEGEIELSIGQLVITYGQELVYTEADRAASLSFKLFRDGIRSIAFVEGLERQELLDLLEVLARDVDPEGLEDDLITLLWEKNFSHITYQHVEEPIDQGEVEAFLSQPPGAREGADRRPPVPAEPTNLGPLPTLLIDHVANDDLAEMAVSQAASRDIFSRLLDTLLEVFPSLCDQEYFPHMAAKIRQLLAWFISQARFTRAIEAISLLRGYAAKEGTPGSGKALEEELGKLIEPKLFSSIALYLEDDSPLFSEAAQLIQLLGPGTVSGLCDLLPGLRTGTKVAHLLADISGEDIQPFLARLHQPNWLVVKWMAMILGLKSDPRALEGLGALLSHWDARVRREGVKALASFPGDSVAKFLTRALSDDDYQVRTLALAVAEQLNCTSLTSSLEEMITRKDFLDRLPVEKKRVFAALGRLGGEAALPLIAKIVQSRLWLRRGKWDEMRACAVAGLEALASPEAIAILERNENSRSPLLREACRAALGRLLAPKKD